MVKDMVRIKPGRIQSHFFISPPCLKTDVVVVMVEQYYLPNRAPVRVAEEALREGGHHHEPREVAHDFGVVLLLDTLDALDAKHESL